VAYNGSRIKEGLLLPNLKNMRNSKANFLLIRCYLSVFFNSIFSLRGGKKDFNFLISK
jgi:hypothetical protein